MPDLTQACWLWAGAKSVDGYGQKHANGATVSVHTESYKAHVGPIPDGLEIDHLCRVRACYNPAHLETVTHAENMRRANLVRTYERGDVCVHGHQKDGVRSDAGSRGGSRRYCKTCERTRARRRRATAAYALNGA